LEVPAGFVAAVSELGYGVLRCGSLLAERVVRS
jgi:hypothetical protein